MPLVDGDRDLRPGAMGLGKHVGVRELVARSDEGVPQPGAVVARVLAVVRTVGDAACTEPVRGCAAAGTGLVALGGRQRAQLLFDQGRYLDCTTPGEPNAATAVL